MEFRIAKAADATEISLQGRLSFSDHTTFRHVLDEFRSASGHRIIFNVSGLDFADSSGLGMFIIAREEAEKKGLGFTISGAHSRVKELMDLAKFDRMFDVRP